MPKEENSLAIIDQDFWGDCFRDLNLTHKNKLFVQRYVANKGNGTKSAKESYDCSTTGSAATIASSLLRLPKIQRAIDRAMEVGQITPEWIKKSIKSIAVDEDVKPQTKLEALKSLGKAEGIFVEKKLVGHVGKIQVDWGD